MNKTVKRIALTGYVAALLLGAIAGTALDAVAQFTPGQVLTASQLNTALAAPTVTGGSINGAPIGGSSPSTGAFTTISATGQITSTLASGTAPFAITSTTENANLNAGLLKGSTWVSPGAIGSTTPSSGAFTTLSASGDASFNGNTILGDASGDSVTVNAQTVNFTQTVTNFLNTVNTSGITASAAGPNFVSERTGTGSSGGWNLIGGTFTAKNSITSGAATAPSVRGVMINLTQASSGRQMNTPIGLDVNASITNSQNMTGPQGLIVEEVTKSSTGRVSSGTAYGAQVYYGADAGSYSAGAVNFAHYYSSDVDVTAVSSYARSFWSDMTAGTGKFALYAAGGADSATAGKMAFGSTTAPTATVDVTGNIRTSTYIQTTAPNTRSSGSYSVADSDNWIINNNAGTLTLTLQSAASYTGRAITVKTITANTVVSASSNVVPLIGGSAGTAILAATAGKWARLVSDGTNWVIMEGN